MKSRRIDCCVRPMSQNNLPLIWSVPHALNKHLLRVLGWSTPSAYPFTRDERFIWWWMAGIKATHPSIHSASHGQGCWTNYVLVRQLPCPLLLYLDHRRRWRRRTDDEDGRNWKGVDGGLALRFSIAIAAIVNSVDLAMIQGRKGKRSTGQMSNGKGWNCGSC